MAAVTLSAFTGLELLNLGVSVSGQVGDVDGDGNPVGPPICGRLFFADDVGTPAVASVAVVGGASIVPAVLSGAEFCLSAFQPACAPPAQFTINVGSGSGGTGAVINVPVVLNFNSDPANPNTGAVQGWSYGLCASGPVEITAAVLGADEAVVKNGAAPGFDTISIFPGQGVTHGLVIDMMAAVTLPAADATAFEDLILTLELGVNEFDPVAGISPCDRALGTPRTANVMVIGGASIAAQKYEGSLADRETETGCCDPAVCNTPGEYTLSLGDLVVAGSVNGDGRMDIADAVYLLSALFRGGPAVLCEKAADVNGDCTLDASDAIWIINYLFLDGPAPEQGLGCVLIESDVCANLTCEVSECQ